MKKCWIDDLPKEGLFITQKNNVDLRKFPTYLEALEYIEKESLQENGDRSKIYTICNGKIDVHWEQWI